MTTIDIGMKLPLPPWSLKDSNRGEKGLIARYGEAEGTRIYRALAVAGGYFDPAREANHAPALDPTPYLDQIRRDNAGGGE